MQGITTGAFPPVSRAFTIFYAVFDLAGLSAVPPSACGLRNRHSWQRPPRGGIGRRAIDGGAPESMACRSKCAIE
jgi:hypothetical protein